MCALRTHFVSAPDGDVHVPVVQVEWNISHRVCKIPSDAASGRVRSARYVLDVEKLPSVVLQSFTFNVLLVVSTCRVDVR